ncbi:MAG: hypothetical protein JHC26_08860 [Thermofilum sp.]|jgi:uncharacterized FlaG/YvyC family protein|uniref:hypothetical protein n=1 Tax=Thermofilum sp. TaxID=1961369 RepID=UPI00258A11B4|nr:hypothetical protein [Thermofilum sp.]MCI4409188.1 hypothetical protein [Thermofilum sp.]
MTEEMPKGRVVPTPDIHIISIPPDAVLEELRMFREQLTPSEKVDYPPEVAKLHRDLETFISGMIQIANDMLTPFVSHVGMAVPPSALENAYNNYVTAVSIIAEQMVASMRQSISSIISNDVEKEKVNAKEEAEKIGALTEELMKVTTSLMTVMLLMTQYLQNTLHRSINNMVVRSAVINEPQGRGFVMRR